MKVWKILFDCTGCAGSLNPVRFVLLILCCLPPSAAQTEPLVVGFERFHAGKPTAEGGRLLYNELGCVNCHVRETGLPARRGPVLTGVTQRVNASWLTAFLASPATEKPGTAMPHLLGAGEAEPIVHYLASLAPKGSIKSKAFKYLNAERGAEVFHTVGCVACHAPGQSYQPPAGLPAANEFTYRSVVFPDLAKKYSVDSMTAFLNDPLKFRPDGRMPQVDLHENDAADLAAHLLDFQSSDGTTAKPVEAFAPDKAKAGVGLEIVKRHRCAACHELPAEAASEPLPLQSFEGGCLSTEPQTGRPFYGLGGAQRAALLLYLSSPADPGTDDAKGRALLSLQALNCTACHSRDGLGGPDAGRRAYFTGDHSLGDTGLFPPGLSDAGRKLKPAWMREVLAGKGRARPYLQTKMPRFGTASESLTALLAEADVKPEISLPPGEAEAGRKLLGILGGNGCITCHRWDKRPSLGVQAIDLSAMEKRYQPGWLREYLIDPAAYRPGTLMPSFWPQGAAANQLVLGGDTDRQIASLLAFSALGKGEPEGYPANSGGEFELIPKDRPIIQRTFMERGGAYAILAGFPAGIHLAYDGKAARPVMVWKGRFFDAYDTWFTRAAPFGTPLGEIIGQWPAASAASAGAHFRGYRLDAAGVPTFLYDTGAVRVEERFEPKDGALHRTLRWQPGTQPAPFVDHPEGLEMREEAEEQGAKSFIYTWK